MIAHRPGTGSTLFILILLATCALALPMHAQQNHDGNRAMENAPRPIIFAENIGQWPGGVLLQGTAGSTTIRFERNQVSYSYLVRSLGTGTSGSERRHLLRTEFLAADPHVAVEGESATGTAFNYYLGASASTWYTNARGFGAVRYRGLYKGIDAVYYGHEGGLKYDFVVAPGADHRTIRLRYHGARRLAITPDGELEVTTRFGSVREAPPYSYQEIDGRRVPVKAAYRLIGDGVYGFTLGAHDRGHPVVIDPCLSVQYSTYFGGGGYDVVTNMAVDSVGNGYAVGFTRAYDFPTLPEVEIDRENLIFVSKISPDGSRLIYSTIIAQTYQGPYGMMGSSQDFQSIGEDVEVARNGEAIVALTTQFENLPTASGSYQRQRARNNLNSACGPPTFDNFDVYVARFSGTGSILWGSYMGGSDNDYLTDIALDASDNIYMTGMTYAPVCGSRGDTLGFPVTIPRDSFGTSERLRGFETFMASLSADGRTLRFGALYGGSGNEFAGAIGLDATNRIYIIGSTNSANLPTTANALQPSAKGGLGAQVYDMYIARINPAAGEMEYSSYFSDDGANRTGLGFNGYLRRTTVAAVGGFERQDRRQGLIVDRSNGTIIFGGTTRSSGLPTSEGAFQRSGPNAGGLGDQAYNAFLVRMNIDTRQVTGATYIGGSNFDALGGITLDRFGDVAVALTTASSDVPISAVTIQPKLRGTSDAAIITLSPDLGRLTYGSYIGGDVATGSPFWENMVYGVEADSAGGIYLYGGTSSRNFPLTPQAVMKQSDYYSGFIVKFSAPSAPRVGTGLGISFEPNTCGDQQTEELLIFNSGQSPMRIESLGFLRGVAFSLVSPPATPFTLAPCDTMTLTVAFDGTRLECKQRATDSLIISAPNAENPRVMVPVSGSRTCLTFNFFETEVEEPRYKLGSGKYVGFTVNVRGAANQYLTITPDPGSSNVFEPVPARENSVLPEGTSGLAFRVNSPDTGYFCASFTAVVEPCHRVFTLKLCAHVRSGIFSGIDTIDYGLISCRELDIPYTVRNVGNDTLEVNIAYAGGPNPLNAEFVEDVSSVRSLAPLDSTTFIIPIRPKGYGEQSTTVFLRTNEGGENGRLRPVTINVELDSVAFRLSSTGATGSFGQTIEMPISYEPIVEGRLPLEELTLHLKFDPKLLAVTGINTAGGLAAGWQIASSRYVPDGTVVRVIKGASGASFTGIAGRLFALEFKVLRGDTMTSPFDITLGGVSAGCLTAEIDAGMLFRLNEECATEDRLIYTGRQLLKQSIPNPAGGMVAIPYHLVEPGHVTLVLYDARGREVVTLVDEERPAGDAEVRFDARLFPAGMYYYRITVNAAMSETRTMVIER